MKQILFVLVLLLSVNAAAQNEADFGTFSVNYFDSVYGSDSGQVRIDTIFSPWRKMAGRFFNFVTEVISGTRDTNFVDDSMWIDLQTTIPGLGTKVYTTHELDSAYDTLHAVIQEDILDADATVLLAYGRLRFIHYDSFPVGTGIPDTMPTGTNTDNIYEKTINLYWDGR